MAYGILIDTSLCIGCKGCQVACKQWWQLGAETTTQTGSYQNPPDLGWRTWSIVRFNEVEADGNLQWVFAKDQCRHCPDPMPCKLVCPHGDTVITKNENGAVIFNQAGCGDCDLECVRYCPYGVPKPEIGPSGEQYCRAFKCRLCSDRLDSGKAPACVTTCLTGALSFGYHDEMVIKAEARVAALRSAGYRNAQIYPNTHGNAMWVLLGSNDAYLLASYTERHPKSGKRPKALAKNSKTPFRKSSLLVPVALAACVGSAIQALGERKNEVARTEEEDEG